MSAKRSDIPVIFLACANSYQAGQRLSYLVRERRRIAEILAREEERDVCEVVQEGNTSKEFFFDEIRKRKYKDRVVILHFAGHADGTRLRFESEEGQEEEMEVSTLADFLKTIKSLHLVFLNGCGTYPIVAHLLRNDIPVVLATQTKIEDRQASKFAEEFYQGIAGGYTIRESFEQARAISRHTVDYQEVNRRSLELEAPDTPENVDFPWGLYVNEGEDQHLDWHLAGPTEAPSVGVPTPSKSGRSSGWKRPEVLVAIAALLVSIVFGLLQLRGEKPVPDPDSPPPDTVLADPPDIIPGPNGPSVSDRIRSMNPDSTFFQGAGENDYKILLLGLIPYDNNENPNVAPTVGNRIEDLEGLGSDWSVEVKEIAGFHTIEDPIPAGSANLLGEKLYADMVVWGEYGFPKNVDDSVKIRIEQKVPLDRFGEAQIIDLQDPKFQTLPFPEFRDSYSLLQDVNQVLYYARIKEFLWDMEHEKAITALEEAGRIGSDPLEIQKIHAYLDDKQPAVAWNLFQQLFEEEPPTTYEAAYWLLRGRFFKEYTQGPFGMKEQERYDSARVAYGKALSADVEQADAYFYRGQLWEVEKEYLEAYRDYSEAIKLQPLYTAAFYSRARLYNQKTLSSIPDLHKKAISDYSRVIALRPEFGYAYHERGLVYYQLLAEGNVSKAMRKALADNAMSDYNRAAELLPRFAYIYQDRGRLYQELNQLAEAEKDYKKATELQPNLYYAYIDNGRLASNQGKYDEALSNYSEAFDAQPSIALRDPQFTQEVFRDEVVQAQESRARESSESLYQGLASKFLNQPNKKELLYKSVEALQQRGEAIPRVVEDSLKKMIEREPALRSRLRIGGK